MGTSSWQQIPHCVDVLMRIQPKCVLDVGVGYGRWGILVHEFCDVWYGRVLPSDWQVRIIGLEAYRALIADYHSSFYDEVIVGDAAEYIRSTQENFDVALFGDVLEHFDRSVADELINRCLEISKYVMVNVPLGEQWEQGEMYGNPFEQHRSEWVVTDFTSRPQFVRHAIFHDFLGRPMGSFVLSRDDPADVRSRLFSDAAAAGASLSAESEQFRTLQGRALRLQEQLDMILNSKMWKLTTAIKRTPLYRLYARKRYGSNWELPYLDMQTNLSATPSQATAGEAACGPQAHVAPGPEDELDECISALERMATRKLDYLAVYPRQWLGVSSSTRSLFRDNSAHIPQLWTVESAKRAARAIVETNVPTVALSGFGQGWWELTRQLRLASKDLRILTIWHGSYAQMIDRHIAALFSQMVGAYRRGHINRLGFVKEGMDDVFNQAGISAGFIKNYVDLPSPEPPALPTRQADAASRCLILASGHYWLKNLYVQIVGAALVPGLEVTLVPGQEDLLRFAKEMRLSRVKSRPLVEPDEVPQLYREHDVALAVTLSECCPMTPLESMNVGVPCLIGPTSHLFGDPYLDRMLVVDRPDNPRAISDRIVGAVENREEIIETYWRWASAYNTQAQATVEEFLRG